MQDNALFVTWTMDCETINEECATGGPENWGLSERAVTGYVQALADRGHAATLFLIPRMGEVQADTLMDLGRQGVDLGMHMHPQTTDYGHDAHLGQLPADTQRALLGDGRERLLSALGEAPTSYRSGCFSASDETFGILAQLGFTQGSVSLPGRVLPDIGAVWDGAEPFAHWASADGRRRAGDLPFLELPTAVDLDDVPQDEGQTGDARHLRLEREGICEWGPDLVRRHLARQIEMDCQPKSLVVMTHNTREYGDPCDMYRQNLEAVADMIEHAAQEARLNIVPATLAQVRAAATTWP